ncbi:MAG TPA: hydroxyisourate hydrolase [Casimicrobiaceae bacterium]|nr:hydroxyisourate hydrolase [Casimicrobiaceae bacterium]
MGKLTTHVLDTASGVPAAGMEIKLYAVEAAGAAVLRTVRLNSDGRCDGPLLEGAEFALGKYRLVFSVGKYFSHRGVSLPDPPFIDEVPLDFGVADVGLHYHVPLLVTPFSYSTYRGS